MTTQCPGLESERLPSVLCFSSLLHYSYFLWKEMFCKQPFLLETWWDNVGFDIYFWFIPATQFMTSIAPEAGRSSPPVGLWAGLGQAVRVVNISGSPDSGICSSIFDVMAVISLLVISLTAENIEQNVSNFLLCSLHTSTESVHKIFLSPDRV